jgi:hypothetical protein
MSAFFAVGVGMSMYLDDYCATVMDVPAELGSWTAISGQRFANPITVECRYDGLGWVQQTDPKPLIYAVGLLGVLLGAVAVLAVWLHRSSGRRVPVAGERTLS